MAYMNFTNQDLENMSDRELWNLLSERFPYSLSDKKQGKGNHPYTHSTIENGVWFSKGADDIGIVSVDAKTYGRQSATGTLTGKINREDMLELLKWDSTSSTISKKELLEKTIVSKIQNPIYDKKIAKVWNNPNTNVEKEQLEKLKATNPKAYEAVVHGIGSVPKGYKVGKTYEKMTDAPELISQTDATDILNKFNNQKSYSTLWGVKAKSGQGDYTVGTSSNMYKKTNKGIEKKNIDVNKLAFFDFETIGVQGKGNWSATQVSVSKGDKNYNKFIQLEGEGLKYINDAIDKIESGNQSKLTPDERRSLLWLTDIGTKELKNGKKEITATHKEYGVHEEITKDSNLLQQIKKGRDILSTANSYSNGVTEKQFKQDFEKEYNFSKATLAGHNITKFDTKMLDKMGISYKGDFIDTLSLFRQAVALGSKNAGGTQQLLGHSMEQAIKYFDIDKKLGNLNPDLNQHTAEYDVQANKILLKQILQNIPSPSQGEMVSLAKGMVGISGKGMIKDSKSNFVAHSTGELVNYDGELSDLKNVLFKSNSAYRFEGMKKLGDKSNQYMARFVEVETGKETILRGTQRYIQDAVGNVFNFDFAKKGSSRYQEIEKASKEKAQENLMTYYSTLNAQLKIYDELYDSSNKRKSNAKLNEATAQKLGVSQGQVHRFNLTESYMKENIGQLREIYKQLSDDPNMSNNMRDYILKTIGNSFGVTSSYIKNAQYIDKVVENGSDATFMSRKKAYLNYLEENKSKFGKDYSTILSAINSVEGTDDDFRKQESGMRGNPFYSISRLMSQSLLNNNPNDYKVSSNSPALHSKLGTDYLTYQTTIKTMIDKIKQTMPFRDGKGVVDNDVYRLYDMFKDTALGKALSGQHLKDRILSLSQKQGGQNSHLENASLFKGGRKAHEGFKPNTSVTDEHMFAKGSLGSQLIELQAKAAENGIGIRFNPNATGTDLSLMFFDLSDSDVFQQKFDEKTGEFTTEFNNSKVAKVNLPIADENGIFSKNGIDAINGLYLRFKDGQAYYTSMQENIVEGLIRAITKEDPNGRDVVDRIKNGDFRGAQSTLKFIQRNILEKALTGQTYSQSVKDEVSSHTKAGGTVGQKALRKEMLTLRDGLTDIFKSSITDNAKRMQAPLDSHLRFMMDYLYLASENTKWGQSEILNNAEVQKLFTDAGVNISDLNKGLLNMVSQLPKLHIEGVKEEAYIQQMISGTGSHDRTAFGEFTAGYMRALDQAENYLERTKQSKENIAKMKKDGKTFDSSFVSGHLSKEELDLQKADGSQSFFNVGHVGEKEISDLINSYYKNNNIKGKSALSSFGLSTYEGMALMTEDMAKTMDSFARKGLQIDKIGGKFKLDADMLGQFGLSVEEFNKWLDSSADGDYKNLEDIELEKDMLIGNKYNKNADLLESIGIKAGSIIHGIKKVGEQLEFDVSEITKMATGKKILTSTGERLMAYVMNADETAALKTLMPNADLLIAERGVSERYFTETIGGRYDYIIQEALKAGISADDIDDVIQNINKGDNVLKKYLTRVQGTNQWSTYATTGTANNGEQVWLDANGNVLFNNAEEASRFMSDLEGGEISGLIKGLVGKYGGSNKAEFESILSRNMTRAAVNMANDASYFNPNNFSSTSLLDAHGNVKIGRREIDSIKKRILLQKKSAEARFGNDTNEGIEALSNLDKLSEYLTNLPRAQRVQDLEKSRDVINQALVDTVTRPEVTNKTMTINLFGDKENLGSDTFHISQFNKGLKSIRNDDGTVSLEDWKQGRYGAIRELMQKGGYDKVRLHFGDKPVLVSDYKGDMQLSDIYLPFFDKLNYVAGNIMPDQIEMAFDTFVNDLIKNDRDLNNGGIKYWQESANKLLQTMHNTANFKESSMYKDVGNVQVNFSSVSKTLGQNMMRLKDTGKLAEFENSVFFSPDKLKAIMRPVLGGKESNIDQFALMYDNLFKGEKGKSFKKLFKGHFDTLNEKEQNTVIDKALENIVSALDINNKDNIKSNTFKSLIGQFHRYPSISGLDMKSVFVRVDSGMANNAVDSPIYVSPGLSYGINMDYDGDTGYFHIPQLGQNFTVNKDDFEGAMKAFEDLARADKDAAMLLGTKVLTEYEKDLAEGKDPVDILAKKQETYDKMGKATVDIKRSRIIDTISKNNKEYVGWFSNLSSAMRTVYDYNQELMSKNTSSKEAKSNYVTNMISNLFGGAFFQTYEQDAISAKKVAERLAPVAEMMGITSKSSINYFSESQGLKMLYDMMTDTKNGVSYKDVIEASGKLGIFKEDENLKGSYKIGNKVFDYAFANVATQLKDLSQNAEYREVINELVNSEQFSFLKPMIDALGDENIDIQKYVEAIHNGEIKNGLFDMNVSQAQMLYMLNKSDEPSKNYWGLNSIAVAKDIVKQLPMYGQLHAQDYNLRGILSSLLLGRKEGLEGLESTTDFNNNLFKGTKFLQLKLDDEGENHRYLDSKGNVIDVMSASKIAGTFGHTFTEDALTEANFADFQERYAQAFATQDFQMLENLRKSVISTKSQDPDKWGKILGGRVNSSNRGTLNHLAIELIEKYAQNNPNADIQDYINNQLFNETSMIEKISELNQKAFAFGYGKNIDEDGKVVKSIEDIINSGYYKTEDIKQAALNYYNYKIANKYAFGDSTELSWGLDLNNSGVTRKLAGTIDAISANLSDKGELEGFTISDHKFKSGKQAVEGWKETIQLNLGAMAFRKGVLDNNIHILQNGNGKVKVSLSESEDGWTKITDQDLIENSLKNISLRINQFKGSQMTSIGFKELSPMLLNNVVELAQDVLYGDDVRKYTAQRAIKTIIETNSKYNTMDKDTIRTLIKDKDSGVYRDANAPTYVLPNNTLKTAYQESADSEVQLLGLKEGESTLEDVVTAWKYEDRMFENRIKKRGKGKQTNTISNSFSREKLAFFDENGKLIGDTWEGQQNQIDIEAIKQSFTAEEFKKLQQNINQIVHTHSLNTIEENGRLKELPPMFSVDDIKTLSKELKEDGLFKNAKKYIVTDGYQQTILDLEAIEKNYKADPTNNKTSFDVFAEEFEKFANEKGIKNDERLLRENGGEASLLEEFLGEKTAEFLSKKNLDPTIEKTMITALRQQGLSVNGEASAYAKLMRDIQFNPDRHSSLSAKEQALNMAKTEQELIDQIGSSPIINDGKLLKWGDVKAVDDFSTLDVSSKMDFIGSLAQDSKKFDEGQDTGYKDIANKFNNFINKIGNFTNENGEENTKDASSVKKILEETGLTKAIGDISLQNEDSVSNIVSQVANAVWGNEKIQGAIDRKIPIEQTEDYKTKSDTYQKQQETLSKTIVNDAVVEAQNEDIKKAYDSYKKNFDAYEKAKKFQGVSLQESVDMKRLDEDIEEIARNLGVVDNNGNPDINKIKRAWHDKAGRELKQENKANDEDQAKATKTAVSDLQSLQQMLSQNAPNQFTKSISGDLGKMLSQLDEGKRSFRELAEQLTTEQKVQIQQGILNSVDQSLGTIQGAEQGMMQLEPMVGKGSIIQQKQVQMRMNQLNLQKAGAQADIDRQLQMTDGTDLHEQIKNRQKLSQVMTEQTKAYNKEHAAIDKNMAKMSQFGQSVKGMLATSFQYGVVYRGAQSVIQQIYTIIGSIQEFDALMIQLRMINGAGEDITANMIAGYKQLGDEMGLTTQEVTATAVTFLRQGRSIADTNELMRQSAILAKTAFMDQNQAAELLTSTLNGFKLEAKDAAKVIDLVAYTDTMTATSADELMTAFQYVASSADTAGIEVEKLNAMIATSSEATRLSAQMIGTAYKTIVSRLQQVKVGSLVDAETGEDISNVDKMLKQYGLTVMDVNGKMKDGDQILSEFAELWNSWGNDTAKKREAVEALAGTRQGNIAMSLFENWDRYEEILSETEANAAGSASKKMDVAKESIQTSLAQLQNAMKAFGSSEWATDAFKWIIDLGTGLAKLLPVILLVGGAWVTMGNGGSRLTTLYQVQTNLVNKLKMSMLGLVDAEKMHNLQAQNMIKNSQMQTFTQGNRTAFFDPKTGQITEQMDNATAASKMAIYNENTYRDAMQKAGDSTIKRAGIGITTDSLGNKSYSFTDSSKALTGLYRGVLSGNAGDVNLASRSVQNLGTTLYSQVNAGNITDAEKHGILNYANRVVNSGEYGIVDAKTRLDNITKMISGENIDHNFIKELGDYGEGYEFKTDEQQQLDAVKAFNVAIEQSVNSVNAFSEALQTATNAVLESSGKKTGKQNSQEIINDAIKGKKSVKGEDLETLRINEQNKIKAINDKASKEKKAINNRLDEIDELENKTKKNLGKAKTQKTIDKHTKTLEELETEKAQLQERLNKNKLISSEDKKQRSLSRKKLNLMKGKEELTQDDLRALQVIDNPSESDKDISKRLTKNQKKLSKIENKDSAEAKKLQEEIDKDQNTLNQRQRKKDIDKRFEEETKKDEKASHEDRKKLKKEAKEAKKDAITKKNEAVNARNVADEKGETLLNSFGERNANAAELKRLTDVKTQLNGEAEELRTKLSTLKSPEDLKAELNNLEKLQESNKFKNIDKIKRKVAEGKTITEGQQANLDEYTNRENQIRKIKEAIPKTEEEFKKLSSTISDNEAQQASIDEEITKRKNIQSELDRKIADETKAYSEAEKTAKEKAVVAEDAETVANEKARASEEAETNANQRTQGTNTGGKFNNWVKSTSKGQAVGMVGSMVGMMGGSMGATQLAQDLGMNSAASSLVGMAGGMGTMALSMVNPIAGAIVGAVGAGFSIIRQMQKEYHEKVINNIKEASDAYKNHQSKLKEIDDQEFKNEFERLSQGVDENGQNVSLSDEEYENYQSAVEKLTDGHEELIKGYNKEGQAIVDRDKILERSLELTKEQMELERKKMYGKDELKHQGKDFNSDQKEIWNDWKKHNQLDTTDTGALFIQSYIKSLTNNQSANTLSAETVAEYLVDDAKFDDIIEKAKNNKLNDANIEKIKEYRQLYLQERHSYEKELQQIDTQRKTQWKGYVETHKGADWDDTQIAFMGDLIDNFKGEEFRDLSDNSKMYDILDNYANMIDDKSVYGALRTFNTDKNSLAISELRTRQKAVLDATSSYNLTANDKEALGITELDKIEKEFKDKLKTKLGVNIDENGKVTGENADKYNAIVADIENTNLANLKNLNSNFKKLMVDDVITEAQDGVEVLTSAIGQLITQAEKLENIDFGDKVDIAWQTKNTEGLTNLMDLVKNYRENDKVMSPEILKGLEEIKSTYNLTPVEMDKALANEQGIWELNADNVKKLMSTMLVNALEDNENYSYEDLQMLSQNAEYLGIKGVDQLGFGEILTKFIDKGFLVANAEGITTSDKRFTSSEQEDLYTKAIETDVYKNNISSYQEYARTANRENKDNILSTQSLITRFTKGINLEENKEGFLAAANQALAFENQLEKTISALGGFANALDKFSAVDLVNNELIMGKFAKGDVAGFASDVKSLTGDDFGGATDDEIAELSLGYLEREKAKYQLQLDQLNSTEFKDSALAGMIEKEGRDAKRAEEDAKQKWDDLLKEARLSKLKLDIDLVQIGLDKLNKTASTLASTMDLLSEKDGVGRFDLLIQQLSTVNELSGDLNAEWNRLEEALATAETGEEQQAIVEQMSAISDSMTDSAMKQMQLEKEMNDVLANGFADRISNMKSIVDRELSLLDAQKKKTDSNQFIFYNPNAIGLFGTLKRDKTEYEKRRSETQKIIEDEKKRQEAITKLRKEASQNIYEDEKTRREREIKRAKEDWQEAWDKVGDTTAEGMKTAASNAITEIERYITAFNEAGHTLNVNGEVTFNGNSVTQAENHMSQAQQRNTWSGKVSDLNAQDWGAINVLRDNALKGDINPLKKARQTRNTMDNYGISSAEADSWLKYELKTNPLFQADTYLKIDGNEIDFGKEKLFQHNSSGATIYNGSWATDENTSAEQLVGKYFFDSKNNNRGYIESQNEAGTFRVVYANGKIKEGVKRQDLKTDGMYFITYQDMINHVNAQKNDVGTPYGNKLATSIINKTNSRISKIAGEKADEWLFHGDGSIERLEYKQGGTVIPSDTEVAGSRYTDQLDDVLLRDKGTSGGNKIANLFNDKDSFAIIFAESLKEISNEVEDKTSEKGSSNTDNLWSIIHEALKGISEEERINKEAILSDTENINQNIKVNETKTKDEIHSKIVTMNDSIIKNTEDFSVKFKTIFDKLAQNLLTLGDASKLITEASKYIGQNNSTGKFSNGRIEEWCADFVSYVLDEIGVSLDKVPRSSSVANFYNAFEANNALTKNPSIGNLAIKGKNDHIGIVASVDGDKVVLIEGNTGNKDDKKSVVSQNTYSLSEMLKNGWEFGVYDKGTGLTNNKDLSKYGIMSEKKGEYKVDKKTGEWIYEPYETVVDTSKYDVISSKESQKIRSRQYDEGTTETNNIGKTIAQELAKFLEKDQLNMYKYYGDEFKDYVAEYNRKYGEFVYQTAQRAKDSNIDFYEYSHLITRYNKEQSKEIDIVKIEQATNAIVDMQTKMGELTLGLAEAQANGEDISGIMDSLTETYDNYQDNLEQLNETLNNVAETIKEELLTDLTRGLSHTTSAIVRLKDELNELQHATNMMFDTQYQSKILNGMSSIVRISDQLIATTNKADRLEGANVSFTNAIRESFEILMPGMWNQKKVGEALEKVFNADGSVNEYAQDRFISTLKNLFDINMGADKIAQINKATSQIEKANLIKELAIANNVSTDVATAFINAQANFNAMVENSQNIYETAQEINALEEQRFSQLNEVISLQKEALNTEKEERFSLLKAINNNNQLLSEMISLQSKLIREPNVTDKASNMREQYNQTLTLIESQEDYTDTLRGELRNLINEFKSFNVTTFNEYGQTYIKSINPRDWMDASGEIIAEFFNRDLNMLQTASKNATEDGNFELAAEYEKAIASMELIAQMQGEYTTAINELGNNLADAVAQQEEIIKQQAEWMKQYITELVSGLQYNINNNETLQSYISSMTDSYGQFDRDNKQLSNNAEIEVLQANSDSLLKKLSTLKEETAKIKEDIYDITGVDLGTLFSADGERHAYNYTKFTRELEENLRKGVITNNEYTDILAKLETYEEIVKEEVQAQDDIVKNYQEINSTIEEQIKLAIDSYNWQIKKQETLLSLKEKQFETENKIYRLRLDLDKELRSAKQTTQWLTESERRKIFNEESYTRLYQSLDEMESKTTAYAEEYYDQIMGLTEDTLYQQEYITNEYERRLALVEMEYNITKQKVDLEKKQMELANVLAEKNSRVYVNGEWRQVANMEDVKNASEEVADIEAELKLAEEERLQKIQSNQMQEYIDSLKKNQAALENSMNYTSDTNKELIDKLSEFVGSIVGEDLNADSLNQTVRNTATSISNFNQSLDVLVDDTIKSAIDTLGTLKISLEEKIKNYTDEVDNLKTQTERQNSRLEEANLDLFNSNSELCRYLDKLSEKIRETIQKITRYENEDFEENDDFILSNSVPSDIHEAINEISWIKRRYEDAEAIGDTGTMQWAEKAVVDYRNHLISNGYGYIAQLSKEASAGGFEFYHQYIHDTDKTLKEATEEWIKNNKALLRNVNNIIITSEKDTEEQREREETIIETKKEIAEQDEKNTQRQTNNLAQETVNVLTQLKMTDEFEDIIDNFDLATRYGQIYVDKFGVYIDEQGNIIDEFGNVIGKLPQSLTVVFDELIQKLKTIFINKEEEEEEDNRGTFGDVIWGTGTPIHGATQENTGTPNFDTTGLSIGWVSLPDGSTGWYNGETITRTPASSNNTGSTGGGSTGSTGSNSKPSNNSSPSNNSEPATNSSPSNKVNTTDQYVKSSNGIVQSNPNWDGKNTGGVGTFYAQAANGERFTTEPIYNVDEIGKELILPPITSGRYAAMEYGSQIVPHNLSENILKWGAINPASINANKPEFTSNLTNNTTTYSIGTIKLDNVTNGENFIPELNRFLQRTITLNNR